MPITFTRIVRTGLASTVSTPAIAAQWTKCVAPAAARLQRIDVEDVALDQLEVRMVGELEPRQRVTMEVVECDNAVLRSTSSRASVVPMKPAPPVMKTRLPSSATRPL